MPISDVVFLEGHDAKEILYSEDTYEKGKWFLAKNIDLIPLSQLGEILGVASYVELMHNFRPILPPEGEQFLLTFPRNLQDKIRRLTNEEIVNAASEWSKIDDFGGWMTTDSLTDYLSSLKDFLNSSNKDAYLYLCV